MNQNPSLFSWYFEPLPEPKTGSELWKWWEKRRILYNIIVVATAFISFIAFEYFCQASGQLAPGDDAVEPMALFFGMFFGPLLWNLAYCLGPIVDVALFLRGKLSSRRGPILLKLGTVFSIMILCIPSGIWFAIWLGAVVKGF